jgi:hypothetical protein
MLDKYLNVNWLKSTGATPHWFGLGFIQLKISDTQRLHFWHPDLVANTHEEEIHDHRYNFASRILRGSIVNHTYCFNVNNNGKYTLSKTDCSPNFVSDASYTGDVSLLSSSTLSAGDEYYMSADTFHRIEATHAVTLLTREPTTKAFARVAALNDELTTCPFSRNIPTNKLWDYIEEACTLCFSGYHSTEIPKGTVGQSSKILEEVLELLDAEKQNNRIMALCELSDIYGAMQQYLNANYKELSMAEVARMSSATTGAFKNGKR